MACGAVLAVKARPWSWRAILAPQAALRSLLIALPLLLLHALPFAWAFYPPNQLLPQAGFFTAFGLGLGLALAWVRQDAAWPMFLVAGMLAGGLAFSCNWLYMVDHLAYRGVYYLANWVDPHGSTVLPFQVLQALRALALGLPLLILAPIREGNWWRLLPDLGWLAVSALLRAQVLGPALGGSGSHLAFMFLCLWALLYGLGRGYKAVDFA